MPKNSLLSYVKKNEWLVCVDSDGCAMDTMESKHKQAFCPQLIRVYGLEAWEKEITSFWMRINLYSRTRGINRFEGLATTFKMLLERGEEIPGANELCDWVAHAEKLSNCALEQKAANSVGLAKALEWSRAVNEVIEQIGNGAHPFCGCKDALSAIHRICDTAVVSSANSEAVEAEWARHVLAPYMDVLLGQNAGTKEDCLQALTAKGYEANHVLMVGDAMGDYAAAQSAHALFYPILVGRESESWHRLVVEAMPRFIAGGYAGAYQELMLAEQREILT